MWNKIAMFLRLPRDEQLLLIEALYTLGRARLNLMLFPFRRIAATLGNAGGESPDLVPCLHDEIARQVGWAVETMARHVPWDSRCLVQALAAWQMLYRRDIAGTIYFGVTSNPDKPFDAHAWLRCGTRFVTGGEPHEQYRVLTCFAQNMAEANKPINNRCTAEDAEVRRESNPLQKNHSSPKW